MKNLSPNTWPLEGDIIIITTSPWLQQCPSRRESDYHLTNNHKMLTIIWCWKREKKESLLAWEKLIFLFFSLFLRKQFALFDTFLEWTWFVVILFCNLDMNNLLLFFLIHLNRMFYPFSRENHFFLLLFFSFSLDFCFTFYLSTHFQRLQLDKQHFNWIC